MGLLISQKHETKPLTSTQTATLQVPTLGKIHDFVLRFATGAGADVTRAAIVAEIGNIRLTVNGKDIINASATRLLDLYQGLGTDVGLNTGVASVVELNIGRLLFVDPKVRDLFGLGTADVTSIQVAVTAGTLSTINNVTAFTNRDLTEKGKQERLGVYCKYIVYSPSFTGTGQHSFDTLPRDQDASYLAVMVSYNAGTITAGEVRANGITIRESLPPSVNAQLLSNQGMQQPTSYFLYNFTDGSFDGRLDMAGVSDFRLLQTFSVSPGTSYDVGALTISGLPTK